MLGEARLAANAVLRAAHGPPQNHAGRALRVVHREGHDRTAPHAAAHEMRALYAEMVQQPTALGDVVLPRDALHPASRLPRLAPIEHDAAIVLREMLQRL